VVLGTDDDDDDDDDDADDFFPQVSSCVLKRPSYVNCLWQDAQLRMVLETELGDGEEDGCDGGESRMGLAPNGHGQKIIGMNVTPCLWREHTHIN
jgi:hypothetical protein